MKTDAASSAVSSSRNGGLRHACTASATACRRTTFDVEGTEPADPFACCESPAKDPAEKIANGAPDTHMTLKLRSDFPAQRRSPAGHGRCRTKDRDDRRAVPN